MPPRRRWPGQSNSPLAPTQPADDYPDEFDCEYEDASRAFKIVKTKPGNHPWSGSLLSGDLQRPGGGGPFLVTDEGAVPLSADRLVWTCEQECDNKNHGGPDRFHAWRAFTRPDGLVRAEDYLGRYKRPDGETTWFSLSALVLVSNDPGAPAGVSPTAWMPPRLFD
jgi:hypothetical protein